MFSDMCLVANKKFEPSEYENIKQNPDSLPNRPFDSMI